MSEYGTDWIVPGAQVVIFSDGRLSSKRDVRVTTIARVTPKTFTVTEENEPRFRIDRCWVHMGDSLRGYTRHVVPADSKKGKTEVSAAHRRSLINDAQSLCEDWQRNQMDVTVLPKLIEALQAVQAWDAREDWR